MKKLLLIVAIATPLISACDPTETEIRMAALHKSPVIKQVGEFEGCKVKFVDRGYAVYSFYIANCQDASVMTRNYSERVGKYTQDRRSTVILKDIDALKTELGEAQTKEAALGKLTTEERKALGVQ